MIRLKSNQQLLKNTVTTMSKNTEKGKELLKEFGKQESSRVTSRIGTAKNAVSSSLLRLVPTRFFWLLPWLKKNVEVSPTLLEDVKGKVTGKFAQKDAGTLSEVTETTSPEQIAIPLKHLYPKYTCLRHNPLACEVPQLTLEEQSVATVCRQCGFPTPLAPETKIKGYSGIYQVESLIGYRGQGRLYQAVTVPERQPVIIKEYLLPERYFNQKEAKERKDAFMRLAGLNLADGRVQDFRIIVPSDPIADINQNRCYLVTSGTLDSFPTLASYLAQTGAMTGKQVRQVLNQVLQSLESLHGQKYRLPNGLVQQKFTHGNLSLDSLLIVPTFQGFLIYLCDIALWEHRFNLPLAATPNYSPSQDLKDLGYIAFYLLTGRTVDPINGFSLNPKEEKHWPLVHPPLKDFILSLIGHNLVDFESAEIARQVLLKLPQEPEIQPILTSPTPETEPPKKRPRLPLFLLLGLGVFLLALLIWFFAFRNRQRTAIATQPLPCCIGQISGIPSGKFTYTAAKDGIWNYVLLKPNLILKDLTLQTELEKRQPKFDLIYEPTASADAAIRAVQSEEKAFAIVSLTNDLSPDLGYKEIAHDALVIIVPFSYAKRQNSLPRWLNGKITYDQLRQLYTGKIQNWQELGGPNLPVEKLYLPTNEEAVRIFEERVLQKPDAIAAFQKLLKPEPSVNPSSKQSPSIIRLSSTFEMLRAIIGDFENGNTDSTDSTDSTRNTHSIGSIGIAPLSQVFGQCSVYPLALAAKNDIPVSPLREKNNQPVTPETDLCNHKGDYTIDKEAIISQKYPLAYPIAVVYPRDNRLPPVGEKFAEILKTTEAQELLSKTGLVPLQPLGKRKAGNFRF
ncbi:MAG: substrate-binding domain-containing protein [Phormidium sp.]